MKDNHILLHLTTVNGSRCVNLGLSQPAGYSSDGTAPSCDLAWDGDSDSDYACFCRRLNEMFRPDREPEYAGRSLPALSPGDVIEASPVNFDPRHGLFLEYNTLTFLCADLSVKSMSKDQVFSLFPKGEPHEFKVLRVSVREGVMRVSVGLLPQDEQKIQDLKSESRDEIEALRSMPELSEIRCVATGLSRDSSSIRKFSYRGAELCLRVNEGLMRMIPLALIDRYYEPDGEYSFLLHHTEGGYLPDLQPRPEDIGAICHIPLDRLAGEEIGAETRFRIYGILSVSDVKDGRGGRPEQLICSDGQRLAFLDPASLPVNLLPFVYQLQATGTPLLRGTVSILDHCPVVQWSRQSVASVYKKFKNEKIKRMRVVAMLDDRVLLAYESLFAIIPQDELPMSLSQLVNVNINRFDAESGELTVKRWFSKDDQWMAADIRCGQVLSGVKIREWKQTFFAEADYFGLRADLNLFYLDRNQIEQVKNDAYLAKPVVIDFDRRQKRLVLVNSEMLASKEQLVRVRGRKNWKFTIERITSSRTGLCWIEKNVLLPFLYDESEYSYSSMINTARSGHSGFISSEYVSLGQPEDCPFVKYPRRTETPKGEEEKTPAPIRLHNPFEAGPCTGMIVSDAPEYVKCLVRGIEVRILKNKLKCNFSKLRNAMHDGQGNFEFRPGCIVVLDYVGTNAQQGYIVGSYVR